MRESISTNPNHSRTQQSLQIFNFPLLLDYGVSLSLLLPLFTLLSFINEDFIHQKHFNKYHPNSSSFSQSSDSCPSKSKKIKTPARKGSLFFFSGFNSPFLLGRFGFGVASFSGCFLLKSLRLLSDSRRRRRRRSRSRRRGNL